MQSNLRFIRPVDGHERVVQSILKTQSSVIQRLSEERARDIQSVLVSVDGTVREKLVSKSSFSRSALDTSIRSSSLSSTSTPLLQSRTPRLRKMQRTVKVPRLLGYHGKLEGATRDAKSQGEQQRFVVHNPSSILSSPSSRSSVGKLSQSSKNTPRGSKIEVLQSARNTMVAIKEEEEERTIESGTKSVKLPIRSLNHKRDHLKLRRKTSLQLIEDLARTKTLSKKELKQRLSKIKLSIVASAKTKLDKFRKNARSASKNTGKASASKKERKGLDAKELVQARSFLTMPLVEINPSKEAQLSARGEHHRSPDDFMRMVHHWTAQIIQRPYFDV